jgi:hypothetical protein
MSIFANLSIAPEPGEALFDNPGQTGNVEVPRFPPVARRWPPNATRNPELLLPFYRGRMHAIHASLAAFCHLPVNCSKKRLPILNWF